MATSSTTQRATSAQPDVEWIVREVVRRLRELSLKGDDEACSPERSRELRLGDRVITMATIDNRLDEIDSVIVQPRAIVTPAAHDELRERGIGLRRGAAQAASDSTPAPRESAWSVIGAASKAAKDQIASLCNGPPLSNGAADEAVRALADAMQRGSARRGVLLSDQPLAAACLACQRGLRATAELEIEGLRRALATMDANVLVLSDRDATAPRGQRALRRFMDDTERGVSPTFQGLLGT